MTTSTLDFDVSTLSDAMRRAVQMQLISVEAAVEVDEEAARKHGPKNGHQLQVAANMGVMTGDAVWSVWAASQGWKYALLDDSFEPDLDLIGTLPAHVARELSVIPWRGDDSRVTFAATNPAEPLHTERLKQYFPDRTIKLAFAPEERIKDAVQKYYSAAREAQAVGSRRSDTAVDQSTLDNNLGMVDNGEGDEAPRILKLLLEEALQLDASDIHLEPIEDGRERLVQARFRIDGDLRKVSEWSEEVGKVLIALVEVRAALDHAQNLTPQSGSFTEMVKGRQADMRVESAPTALGKEVTIRIQHAIARSLGSLGFTDLNLERYEKAFRAPYGMILCTGPTGSGKSTTQYSTLLELRDEKKKILTLENPVETRIAYGVSQTSINDQQNLSFASGLRSILRRDPDVILLGEIRDEETAKVATDAALTGHLMLSTLHTNDAPGAIARLRELDVKPSLLADALLAIVAQRLVKRLCSSCKLPFEMTAEYAARLGFAPAPEGATFYRVNEGSACETCKGAGTRGRTPIHEVLTITPAFKKLIYENASEGELTDQARRDGMTTLREDGWAKAAEGIFDPHHVAATVARDLS